MATVILFFGSPEDPHLLEVEKQIKALDNQAKVVLFDPLCGKHFIEITVGSPQELRSRCFLVVDDQRISAESIKSVWYRWNAMSLTEVKDLQSLRAQNFSVKEWKSVLRSLESYLSHTRWVNPFSALELLHCKSYQLKLAQEVGMTVPNTTITNNPRAVGRIFDEVDHGRVVFKSLTPLFLPPDKLLYTTEITKEFPLQSAGGIVQCPAIYQELVERKSDLRITVVGRDVFAVRISSQILGEQKDRLDWRRCQDKGELYSVAQVTFLPFCSSNFINGFLIAWDIQVIMFCSYYVREQAEKLYELI